MERYGRLTRGLNGYGYVIWGLSDDGNLCGTEFEPRKAKKGNEDLEPWLVRQAAPRLHLRFHEGTVEDHRVVVLEVPAATHTPVNFNGVEFIRIGSYKKLLKDYPEKERRLWDVFRSWTFEQDIEVHPVRWTV